MDWEVHDETKGGESLSWFLRLNMNFSHLSKSVDREPVVQLPRSLREHDLQKKFLEINHSTEPYFTKCYKALDWLFSYDDIASEIPTDYWPTHRVSERPIREFLMVVKWFEMFQKPFHHKSWSFSPRLPAPVLDSGNTPLDGGLNAGKHPISEVFPEEQIYEELYPPRYVRKGRPFLFNPHVYNTSYDWVRISKLGNWIRDIILLASMVWLVPIYEPTTGVMSPLCSSAPSFSYWWLVGGFTAIVALSLTLWFQYLVGVDFELSTIDLLSRQAQTISELEVRLIRMHAANLDLEDIIEGIETVITASSGG
jgi:hypothetical protein